VANSNGAYCETEAVESASTVSVLPETIGVDPVVEFYTDHPYPPPVENLDRARDEWRDENRLRAEYHLVLPNKPYRDDLNILVAGCGTWQAARHALCRPAARVTGIDVSTTSLERTERLKKKYNLTNLETERLPIENAGELGQQFDLIITDQVMPHMNGREMAGRVKKLRPDVRVLYMSGYTEDAIAHRGVLDAGVSLISKPFTQESLARKLRELLDPPPAPEQE